MEAFFKKHFPFNTDGLKELLDSFEVRLLKKGALILQSGKIEQELTFINTGYVREFYSADSKEVNINFYSTQEFSTDMYSFYNSSQTKKYQACISDVEVQVLSKEKFDLLLLKYNCGNALVSQAMLNLIKAKEVFEFDRNTKSTEELYRNILLKKPEWLQNIPQYHIASYLKVTPETLSRIRKRIS